MKKLIVAGLIILAILSAIVAVVYFTKTAGNLPHFYPGYLNGSSHKHLKHGIAFSVLAVVLLLGAWMVSGQHSTDNKKAEKPKTEDNS